MANVFDQFDGVKPPDQVAGNPFDQFDSKKTKRLDVDQYMTKADEAAEKNREPSFMGSVTDPEKEAKLRGLQAPSLIGSQLAGSEAGLHMGTGILGSVAGDIAGLGAIPYQAIKGALGGENDGTAPDRLRENIQRAMTYQPRHIEGALASEYNPIALAGNAVGFASNALGSDIRGNAGGNTLRGAVGNFAQEAAPQILGILGARSGPPVLRAAGETGARIAAPVADAAASSLRNSAESLMQSALKPTLKQIKKGDASVAIDTMLDENIPLSKKGMQQVRDKIDVLNGKIEDAIQNSTGTVKIKDIEPLVKERLERALKQANPQADVAATNQAWENFKNHPLIAGKDEIPVQLAQELKQGTYKQLSKKYGEMGSADVEAQKAIARGLKEGVAANAPEVVDFNKEESRLIRTLPVMERRVLMDANKNPMGLSLLTHNPVTWAAFMLDKSATFKAMVARILNATGEKIPFQTREPKAPVVAPATGRLMSPPPLPARAAAPIPERFRTPEEKSRAVRDADKFGMPPGRKLREWYYSDENPNNPLK